MYILLLIKFDMKRKSLTEKNMKIKNHFLTWLLAILPTVLFFVILWWLLSLILRRVGKIVELFPDAIIDKLLLPEIVIHFMWFLVLCVLIWLLWFIMNQWRVWEKVKACLDPLIEKVPLLSSLTKITNQAANTLKNTNSFITGEKLDVFEDASWERNLISVFIPTTPNPANGFLVLLNPKDFIEVDVSVADAISFVISMGTVWATNEILRKTKKSDF